ncbi:MAG: cytochrome c3 family protein [Phycisphaeraceae bacterium]|nr:cytochrome c3 family protein [Phycisphaeraceae bacterium]
MSVLFPKWFNSFPTLAAVGGGGFLLTAIGAFWYWATPAFWEVGYQPIQPVEAFSHQIHAGRLGMDCRYCHTKVEVSAEANVPNVATCYGCHAEKRLAAWSTQRVSLVREAYAKDASIEWRRIHKLPDYVRNFPHNVHLAAGVSCYSCHGQITAMPVVHQVQSLSMSWCLDCHRNPESRLVPKDRVTQLVWVQNFLENRGVAAAGAMGSGGSQQPTPGDVVHSLKRQPPQGCGACHY